MLKNEDFARDLAAVAALNHDPSITRPEAWIDARVQPARP
jgi:hypothetical protein